MDFTDSKGRASPTVGGGGMSARHCGLHLKFDMLVDCGGNDIREFGDQVPHIGRPSMGLRWSGGCQSGLKGGRRGCVGFCAVRRHGNFRNYGFWTLNESTN